MTAFDPFGDWLHDLAYLTIRQTLDLPAWMQTIAFVNQFAVTHLNDGAGALFYNEPERVRPVAAALAAIDESELSTAVLRLLEILLPKIEHKALRAHDILREEPLATLANELDEHIERRWVIFHDKLRALAEANGWQAESGRT